MEREELRVRPDVGAVQRHIDRDVPDDLNPPAVGIALERAPLAKEKVLQVGPESGLPLQLPAPILERRGLAGADVRIPLLHRRLAEAVLERHEERVVGQPVRVLLLEAGDTLPLAQKSPLVSLMKQLEPPVEERLVIHPPGVAPKVAGRAFLSCEQPVAHQQLEVDEIRVPRKGGEGLIGRVAVARRPQGQDLPYFCPAAERKSTNRCASFPSVPIPYGEGERKDGEQNPARSHKNHPFAASRRQIF